MSWTRVEDGLPEPGLSVLAYYETSHGHGRRVRAQYSDGKTLHADMDACDSEWATYDEEADEFYCPEGWYETNEHEDVHWQIDEPVTHWCHLPPPPGGDE